MEYNQEERDRHHISWKNHGVDQYISDALARYLKRKGERQD
jgi:hypothetical protein